MAVTIERVDVFGVAMPLAGAFTSAGISKSETRCVVVRLTASDGTVGISSIDPSSTAKSPHTAPELALVMRDRVASALVGENPVHANRIVELARTLGPINQLLSHVVGSHDSFIWVVTGCGIAR